MARKGFETLRRKLSGKVLFRRKSDGSVRVSEAGKQREEGEENIKLEELVEEGEEVIVEQEVEETADKESIGSGKSGTGTIGYGFLEELDEEE